MVATQVPLTSRDDNELAISRHKPSPEVLVAEVMVVLTYE